MMIKSTDNKEPVSVRDAIIIIFVFFAVASGESIIDGVLTLTKGASLWIF